MFGTAFFRSLQTRPSNSQFFLNDESSHLVKAAWTCSCERMYSYAVAVKYSHSCSAWKSHSSGSSLRGSEFSFGRSGFWRALRGGVGFFMGAEDLENCELVPWTKPNSPVMTNVIFYGVVSPAAGNAFVIGAKLTFFASATECSSCRWRYVFIARAPPTLWRSQRLTVGISMPASLQVVAKRLRRFRCPHPARSQTGVGPSGANDTRFADCFA